MKTQSQSEKVNAKLSSSYVRVAAVCATVIPVAAFLGGVNLGNHNETFIRA